MTKFPPVLCLPLPCYEGRVDLGLLPDAVVLSDSTSSGRVSPEGRTNLYSLSSESLHLIEQVPVCRSSGVEGTVPTRDPFVWTGVRDRTGTQVGQDGGRRWVRQRDVGQGPGTTTWRGPCRVFTEERVWVVTVGETEHTDGEVTRVDPYRNGGSEDPSVRERLEDRRETGREPRSVTRARDTVPRGFLDVRRRDKDHWSCYGPRFPPGTRVLSVLPQPRSRSL